MDQNHLQGRRVLVVEDELMIVWQVEDMLAFYGCEVVGPAGELDQALAIARDAAIDCALLDLNLGGAMSYPVADALAERNVPVIFTTAYDRARMPDAYRGLPLLQKPYEQLALRDALTAALAPGAAG